MEFIHDQYKTQQMCNEAMRNNLAVFFLFLNVLELKKYVLRELRKTQGSCIMSLSTLRRRRCAIRQWPSTHTRWDLFLITLRPKKCVMPQWGKTWFFDICPRFVCDTTASKIMAWWRWFLWWWWDYWVVRRLSKTQGKKAQIEKELMHNARHPLRWWDWSMSETKKNRHKKCGSSCFKISDMLRLKMY